MRARYYDPASGRFISEDPGQNGTNWYAYCGYNPVNMVDQDGKVGQFLAAVFLALAIASVVTALVGLYMLGLELWWMFELNDYYKNELLIDDGMERFRLIYEAGCWNDLFEFAFDVVYGPLGDM